jgi:hypothetical protein
MKHKLYIHRFTVSGHMSFPLDMLRYDTCFPRATSDVDAMERNGERRTVVLEALGKSFFWEPTFERWLSFGWTVLAHKKVPHAS